MNVMITVFDHRDGRQCTPHLLSGRTGTHTEYWYDGMKVCKRKHDNEARFKVIEKNL